MMKFLTRSQIEQLLDMPTVLRAIERGFVLYSNEETVVPPVGILHFDHPPGDCHIKYGYAKEGKYYVVKIASGFPNNPKIGLPAGNGLVLLFDKLTGQVLTIMLDEGYLTDIRTAAAGCVTAKYLAPQNISCVGIVGAGAQAYYQLKLLEFGTKCRQAMIWGRDTEKVNKLKNHLGLTSWQIEVAKDVDTLTATCNLIVTTTSSSAPLLWAHQIRPGTHITAVGADDYGKQELDPEIFVKAQKIVVDSRSQCMHFGDVSHAIKKTLVREEQLVELGEVIKNRALGRNSEAEITVADLTGVAIQDLQMATLVYEQSMSNS